MVSFEETPQWLSGQSVAEFLDQFFIRRGWQIKPTSPYEERVLCLGDRHYRKDGRHLFIEYKSGLQTAATGNVFLETISVDAQDKPGWVYTCQADYIFYATLLNKMILVMIPATLRQKIEQLKGQFRETKTGKAQNKGYNTHGVVIPLDYVVRNLTWQVITFNPGTPPAAPAQKRLPPGKDDAR